MNNVSFELDPTIISALIALAGTALAAFVSYIVSKLTASQELKKLEATWEHQKAEDAQKVFGDMVSSVYRLVVWPSPENIIKACTYTATVLSLGGKASASVNRLLNLLVSYLDSEVDLKFKSSDKLKILKALETVIYDSCE